MIRCLSFSSEEGIGTIDVWRWIIGADRNVGKQGGRMPPRKSRNSAEFLQKCG